jgi:hypothetical protein
MNSITTTGMLVQNIFIGLSIICFVVSFSLFRKNEETSIGELILLFITGWLTPVKMSNRLKPTGVIVTYAGYLFLFLHVFK